MSQSLGRCPSIRAGLQCVLPTGHPGDHQAEMDIPLDVGQMIERHIQNLEAQTKAMRRARTWMIAVAALNLVFVLYNLIAAFTHIQ